MELVARGYAEQNRKLVATDARNGFSFQDRCLQHIRNVPKDGITDPVSIGFVDRLEFVDVDERDAEGFRGDQPAIDRCRNLALQSAAVHRPCQWGEDDRQRKLGLDRPTGGDLHANADDPNDLP